MPNISAMPQPSEVRQTLPRGAGAASSGASSPAATAASWQRARSDSLRRSIHSTPIHGSAAATATSAHAPTEMRQTRSEEHTSEIQSLMRRSYAVFSVKKKKNKQNTYTQQYKSS